MLRARGIVAFFVLSAGISLGQNVTSSDQETIRLLVQQVRELQEKVAVLEGKEASQPAERAEPSASAQPAQEAAAIESPPALDLHEVHGIQWRGFGEVNYKALDQRQPELGTFGFVPGSAANFYTGDFDLFLTSKISDKASVLAELVFGQGDAQSFSVGTRVTEV